MLKPISMIPFRRSWKIKFPSAPVLWGSVVLSGSYKAVGGIPHSHWTCQFRSFFDLNRMVVLGVTQTSQRGTYFPMVCRRKTAIKPDFRVRKEKAVKALVRMKKYIPFIFSNHFLPGQTFLASCCDYSRHKGWHQNRLVGEGLPHHYCVISNHYEVLIEGDSGWRGLCL